MDNILSPSINRLVSLSGKTSIVTGGAMGIGRAICFRLAEAGASVAIVDINRSIAEETASKIIENGGKAIVIKADVSHVQDADRVIKKTIDVFNGIDILVNNAGIFPASPALETSESEWDRVMGVNLKGTFFYSQLAANEMKKSGKGGKIVNIASIGGFKPTGNTAHYDTSKGGIIMMTMALAIELAPYKITVNAVAPGGTKTEGTDEELRLEMEASGLSAKEIRQPFIDSIPLKRMGEADDIARVVFFLSSGLSEYMTGNTIIVDGGFLLS
jgi:2-deoxy-D-gluconate 3-dehydrogenase